MKQVLLSLLAIFILLAACNKTPTATLSREDMLRKGKWKITAGKVKMRSPRGIDTTLIYLNYRPLCHRDDYIRFDSINRGYVFNNGTSCSSADADSISFQWRLTNNENTMDIFNGFTLIDSIAETVFMDTAWEVRYDSAFCRAKDIRNATITSFSQASFVMNFDLVGKYLDTTGGHQAAPVVNPDTFHYSITYGNF